jgi:hypothetical protein
MMSVRQGPLLFLCGGVVLVLLVSTSAASFDCLARRVPSETTHRWAVSMLLDAKRT